MCCVPSHKKQWMEQGIVTVQQRHTEFAIYIYIYIQIQIQTYIYICVCVYRLMIIYVRVYMVTIVILMSTTLKKLHNKTCMRTKL